MLCHLHVDESYNLLMLALSYRFHVVSVLASILIHVFAQISFVHLIVVAYVYSSDRYFLYCLTN